MAEKILKGLEHCNFLIAEYNNEESINGLINDVRNAGIDIRIIKPLGEPIGEFKVFIAWDFLIDDIKERLATILSRSAAVITGYRREFKRVD